MYKGESNHLSSEIALPQPESQEELRSKLLARGKTDDSWTPQQEQRLAQPDHRNAGQRKGKEWRASPKCPLEDVSHWIPNSVTLIVQNRMQAILINLHENWAFLKVIDTGGGTSFLPKFLSRLYFLQQFYWGYYFKVYFSKRNMYISVSYKLRWKRLYILFIFKCARNGKFIMLITALMM